MTQALNLANFANFLNTAGQVSNAGLQSPSVPSGAVMLFYQSSAPTGWTQVTSVNDVALRLVSGTGGTTGGTTAFSTVFANQTPSINVSGLSAGATTLSTTQMPSHTHGTYYGLAYCGGTNSFQQSGGWASLGTTATSSTGGGGSHTHSISGSASSSAITLNVQYANIIICSKN